MYNLSIKNYFFMIFSFLFVCILVKAEIENRSTLSQLATKGAITEAVFILKNKRNKFKEHQDKVKKLDSFNIDKSVYVSYLNILDVIIRDFNDNIEKLPKISNLTDNILKDQVSRSNILYDILKYRDQVFDLLFDIYKSKKNILRINDIIDKKFFRINKIQKNNNKKDLTVVTQVNEIKKTINNLKNTILSLKSGISKDYYDLDCAKEKLLKIEKKYKDISDKFVDFESNFYKSQFLKKIELIFLK